MSQAFAVKAVGANGQFQVDAVGGTTALMQAQTLTARVQTWTTYLFISRATATGTTNLRFFGTPAGSVTIDVAHLQTIEFTNLPAAYAYADARVFAKLTDDLQFEGTYDPAAFAADGDVTNTTVTVTGALVGDACFATHTAIGANNILVSCHVETSDNVRVVYLNKTGGAANIASGTQRVHVFRR